MQIPKLKYLDLMESLMFKTSDLRRILCSHAHSDQTGRARWKASL